MEEIVIEGTKYSPRVELYPTGSINIQGRSILEDPFTFYNPILTWIRNTTLNSLNVAIKLEYLNTSSSVQIYKLLSLIQENYGDKNVSISWYYEEDDEDMLEAGEDYESIIRVPFKMIEIVE